jgi:amino acid transporter
MATTSPGSHSQSPGTPAGRTSGSASGSTSTSRHHEDQDRIIAEREQQRRDEYGGFNWGADFFGWLVAVAVAVLLTGIVAAVAAAIGSQLSVTQNAAQRAAGEIGIGTAIALLVVLMIGYFAGGYVAGRMSRYDGGRQGVGVWIIGLLVTIVVAVIGAVFGSQYDPLQQVDLPNLPVPTDAATTGGLIALAAVLVGTLIAAFFGGKLGNRYHQKVDRVGA